MGNINRVPSGLLSLMDSQTQGQNPDNLSPNVQSVLQLDAFYYLNKGREQESVSGAALQLTTALSAAVIVPQNEIWACHVIGGQITLLDALASNIRFSVVYSLDGLSTPVNLVPCYNVFAMLQTSVAANSLVFPQPFLANPGSAFQIRLDHQSVPLVLGVVPEPIVIFTRLRI